MPAIDKLHRAMRRSEWADHFEKVETLWQADVYGEF